MRILFAGATGVLGRVTIPRLRVHEVVGLTRSSEKLALLRRLGAEALLCDVYDYEALLEVAKRIQPQTVVNFVTDLSSGPAAANTRARREGGDNLRNAANAAGASRLVVESIAFTLDGPAAEAVEHLERSTREFSGDALILRFGRLWGPQTFYERPPSPPAVAIEKAGAQAARLLAHARPGTYIIA